MLKFIENFTIEYESEYKSEYDLSQKRNYSTPKIYSASGDLTKRWYVYFSYREPKSGKLKRLPPIYGKVNALKTKEDRLAILTAYRRVLLKLLKSGFNPFEDNSDLIKGKTDNLLPKKKEPQKPIEPTQVKGSPKEEQPEEERMTIEDALKFGLELKQVTLSQTAYRSFKSHIKIFKDWLVKDKPDLKYIDEVNKKIVITFLNKIVKETSTRNRNNFRVDISSLIQLLYDNELVTSNFVKPIPVLKTTPKRNKKFTPKQDKEILQYLEKEDPLLLLFIKFVSINFLRPIEVCRLRVGDLNIEEKQLQFKAKNSPLKTKLIPKLLLDDLPDLSQLDPDLYLFTPQAIGGEWNIIPDNKRGYFSNRFKKVVKDKFGLGIDYGLYSYRHTYITMIYRELTKQYSEFEAKSRLMQITGQSSMAALETYLRDIDAILAEDYSNYIEQSKKDK
ncbi:site-specific integrase [Algibacter mikhailovii]|uniref:site-specific integrase n=1 Tax=Algibacter mikhailovii TaxID=425498 RepID=UPI002495000C|nr:site-specific integrase [Algibacter mikhailovii]